MWKLVLRLYFFGLTLKVSENTVHLHKNDDCLCNFYIYTMSIFSFKSLPNEVMQSSVSSSLADKSLHFQQLCIPPSVVMHFKPHF